MTVWKPGLRALCLAGPTASGKSALAMALARHLPLEIISVDSALVYRGMDVGTAKPSMDERAEVPHYLIDLIEPTQTYSAARFVADARDLIAAINARGKLALLVGGTMLYFKALREGLDPMPPADAGVRAQIDGDAAQRGWPALHAELREVDPTTAARLAPHDAQRIQRGLEVFRLSGRPLSAWQLGRAGRATDDTLPLLSLEPTSREWLHRRIAQRFDAMLDNGLIDEVRRLRKRADLHPAMPSMRCVGYRQVWAALDAAEQDGQLELRNLRESGIAATRQLAKRQLTWLRSMRDRQVLACDAGDPLPGTLQALQRLSRH
ncbi:MAG TPA: tRNA (adenosine(37)-N6)-dimethylallyltransferase MiaA [Rubrivivax sp.]|nr:tRNA (adenosine(37)-N6)-dimethylallyltransferase MiaA [Rubrivivax sp.]